MSFLTCGRGLPGPPTWPPRLEGRIAPDRNAGRHKAELDPAAAHEKRLTITASTLRAATGAEQGPPRPALRENVWLLRSRGLKP